VQAVAYIRASTEEQHLGPEAQRAAIQAWAAQRGTSVLSWHEDLGVTGAIEIERRPGLLAALAALARAPKGSLLVVSRRDRLARDPMISAMVERLCAKTGGARVVSCAGEGTGGDTPGDVLMRTMIDAFAQFERLIIKQRTSAAMQAKIARGESPGELRYGTRLASDGRHVEENPEEQETIAEIVRLRASGLSPYGITRQLALAGSTSRNGKPWLPEQVRRILERSVAGGGT
jgi:DNA invertase Pin-like site-specific DNA recombinase